MPKGFKTCVVCQGSGVVKESSEYENMFRDPITSRCMHCNGKGLVGCKVANPGKGLPAAGAANANDVTRGLKSTIRPAEASVTVASDTKMIDVMIKCRLTYEQLAELMRYNQLKQGDK